jgi:glycerol-1-phosphate dehydrogenase [NAD(P)+]
VELVDELERSHRGDHDMVAAVGSGTVNDLAKELARRWQRPCFVLATAASMNGYTSAIVALLEAGLKTTRPAPPPLLVLADPEVLATAPPELARAGLGDLVSKPYCGCDWKIAALLRDQYHCPLPDRLLSRPFERALEELPGLGLGTPQGARLLFKLLLISGLSMAVVGSSSPASGGEHLLSHYWDMVRLREGARLNLHGAQVGVASLVVDDLYRQILAADFAAVGFVPSPPAAELEQELAASFGTLAEVVWPHWRAKMAARSARDLERLRGFEATIKGEIRATLSTGSMVRRALAGCGAATRVEALGIDRGELAAALLHGRKIRDRYTVLDVAAELDLLQAFAERSAGGEG